MAHDRQLVDPLGADARATAATFARRGGAPIVLALVVAVGAAVFGDSFIGPQNLGNIALDSSYLVLIAIGMTFVIISGGIDLSVGSVFALAGVLAAYGAQWGSLVAVALPLVGLRADRAGQRRAGRPGADGAVHRHARRRSCSPAGWRFAASQEGNEVHLIPPDLVLTRIGQADDRSASACPCSSPLVVFVDRRSSC